MSRLQKAFARLSGVLASLTPIVVHDRREARALGIGRQTLHLVKAWHLDLLPSLSILDGGFVIDAGAHEGLWTESLLQIAPTARVLAIEPQDPVRAQLQRRFAHDGRVTVEPRAVADRVGEREFHLLGSSVNASLLSPHPGMDALYARGWDVRTTVQVETTTLDALTSEQPVALLKIDVQGAEHEVLEGATETLTRTTAVMLEVTFVTHYQGDATFSALDSQMTNAGFRLAGISPPARSPRGAMLTADACYVSLDQLDDYLSARTK